MLDVTNEDYVRTARAKGLTEQARRTTATSCATPGCRSSTVIGLQVGGLLAGAVITETVFAWPGVGRYVVDAIQDHDYLVVQSAILIFAFIFLDREPDRRHRVRVPQPADPVRLMAAIDRRSPLAARRSPSARQPRPVARRRCAGCVRNKPAMVGLVIIVDLRARRRSSRR